MKHMFLIALAALALVGCGDTNRHGMDMKAFEDYRKRVDACIVEHGIGPGVKDFCEALARKESTPTPAAK